METANRKIASTRSCASHSVATCMQRQSMVLFPTSMLPCQCGRSISLLTLRFREKASRNNKIETETKCGCECDISSMTISSCMAHMASTVTPRECVGRGVYSRRGAEVIGTPAPLLRVLARGVSVGSVDGYADSHSVRGVHLCVRGCVQARAAQHRSLSVSL